MNLGEYMVVQIHEQFPDGTANLDAIQARGSSVEFYIRLAKVIEHPSGSIRGLPTNAAFILPSGTPRPKLGEVRMLKWE